MIIIKILVIYCLLFGCDGLKILLVPVAIRSHVLELAAIGEKLAGQGHGVSLVLPHTFPNIAHFRERGIHMMSYVTVPDAGTFKRTGNTDDIVLYTTDIGDMITEDMFVRGDRARERSARHGARCALRDCEAMLQDTTLNSSIERTRYDIAIVDAFHKGYCNFLLPLKHGIPFVSSYSGGFNPSFSPYFYGHLGSSSKMSFFQRLVNTVLSIKTVYFPPGKPSGDLTLLHKHAPEVPSWEALLRMSELFFIHRDLPLEGAYVSMSNFIRTHGVTVRDGQTLPSHVQDVITKENKNKFVIVTFGSLISTLPDRVLEKFFRAFSAFPDFLFLMRINRKLIPAWRERVPAHVRLLPWLPQQDLLADRRTVLFITHGGSNGQWEAVYHGVPLICMPIFADQKQNCQRTTTQNLSLTLDIFHLTAHDLTRAVSMVTSDRRFRRAASRASSMIREAALPVQEVMSYWLDHVVKYGGQHLRPGSMDLSLMEFLMIDVFLFIFIVISILIYGSYKLCIKPLLYRGLIIQKHKDE